MKVKVFVYGTLLSGEPNSYKLAGAEFIGDGKLGLGFKMLDLGPFPAVVETEDIDCEIIGEVYEVNHDTLCNVLDRLECVDPKDPEDRSGRGCGMYYRRELGIELDGKTISAHVYLMRAGNVFRRGELIDSGSWRERRAA